jgi:HD-GYP domain-containing protein (c-di-GMP phosphodiesterase class II)
LNADITAGALGGVVPRAQRIHDDLRAWIGPQDFVTVLGPTAFFVAAISLLTYDHTSGSLRGRELIFWAALALVVTVFTWLLVRVGGASRAMVTRHLASYRDELTGLGSAAALRADLATTAERHLTAVLLVIELEAPAAREEQTEQTRAGWLLSAAGEITDIQTQLSATAYRTEGPHFALLAQADPANPADMMARARASLVGAQQVALAGAHVGEVELPREATRPDHVLHLAAERLAASKRNGFRSARRQAHAALLAALSARRPELRSHLRSVVPRVISVGRRMGLDREQLDDVVLAAGLQDIGMLTISESILERPGPLSAEDRALLHAHPLAGEQIVGSATALSSVAELVRTSYERYDGSGYPHGLVGHEIPLGARIIAPCVAAAAMMSNRPHRRALSLDQAVAELLTASGSQFDPRVVTVLVEELTADGVRMEPSPVGA